MAKPVWRKIQHKQETTQSALTNATTERTLLTGEATTNQSANNTGNNSIEAYRM